MAITLKGEPLQELSFKQAFFTYNLLALMPGDKVEEIDGQQAMCEMARTQQPGQPTCMQLSHRNWLKEALLIALRGIPNVRPPMIQGELHERMLPWVATLARASSVKPKEAKAPEPKQLEPANGAAKPEAETPAYSQEA
jgi:hypothetical protein